MIEIFECKQGTPEWYKCRLGIPTASEFHSMLAGGQGKTRRTYLYKLVGERVTGESQETFTNMHTERGHVLEAEARDLYSYDVANLRTVGFIRRGTPNGFVGCSPDALVGDDGLLEIKTKLPHLQIEVLLGKRLPPDHVAQCQGALWVSGRKWLDFVSYWPGLPLFTIRVFPDLEYFAKLEEALEAFNKEMDAVQTALPLGPATRLPRRAPQLDPANEFTNLDRSN